MDETLGEWGFASDEQNAPVVLGTTAVFVMLIQVTFKRPSWQILIRVKF